MFFKIVDKAITFMSPQLLGRALKNMPDWILERKRDDAFRNIVRYAYQKSPFYRKKFDEFGIRPDRVKKSSDLGNFYTTPDDIINNAEAFLCRKPHAVFESSGTTGRNKRLYMTQDELDDIGRLNAMGFFLWGATLEDRLVNAFDFSIWIPGIITQKGIEKSRMLGVAAGKVNPIEVYKRIPIYNFTVVLGEPTWLIKLTEIAEKEGSYPLKFIVGGAEEMPDAARPWMRKVWRGAEIRMVYASVESGGIIGSEMSSECDGYHIDEYDFMVEIADPDKEGYGEVTFTTLSRLTMPLIRYRNRDISKIIDGRRCPCGLPYRRLARMRGRCDELVVASGGNLYPLLFEEILKDVEDITSDWQIVFKLRGMKEVMEFNIELKEGAVKDAVEKKIFQNMKVRCPDLWKNFSIRIFEIEVACHAPKALRVNARKLLRIVDKRYVK